MKKEIETNYRVEVWPVLNPFVRDNGKKNAIAKDTCEEILKSIRRHVDEVADVLIARDIEQVCSYCGSTWTEDNNEYNGGCCDKDEENAPKEQVGV